MTRPSSLFHIRQACRGCGAKPLINRVQFNPLPITSPNVGLDGVNHSDIHDVSIPLDLCQCPVCGLLQLSATIDPAFQYNQFQYVTTISLGLPEHFRLAAKETLDAIERSMPGIVVEIGSNDGTLLQAYKEHGWTVLGIDPATKAVQKANEQGIPTILGFFGDETASEIIKISGAADLIVSNNTLANIDNLSSFSEGIKKVLSTGGVFVFETSYGLDVVHKSLLDTIYFEHISYFTVKPLVHYFKRFGLDLFRVDKITTKGGSIRGFVQHAGGPHPRHTSIEQFISTEQHDGLYDETVYDRMAAGIETRRQAISEIIEAAKVKGQRIGAWGASVGCLTLINQFDLAPHLECIVDDQPLLEKLTGPGYAIPVIKADLGVINNLDVIIILAWRYADNIIPRYDSWKMAGGLFIQVAPEVKIL